MGRSTSKTETTKVVQTDLEAKIRDNNPYAILADEGSSEISILGENIDEIELISEEIVEKTIQKQTSNQGEDKQMNDDQQIVPQEEENNADDDNTTTEIDIFEELDVANTTFDDQYNNIMATIAEQDEFPSHKKNNNGEHKTQSICVMQHYNQY